MTNDINMLISIINTRLRDDDMSFTNLLDVMNIDKDDFEKQLSLAGYYYDIQTNQIKER